MVSVDETGPPNWGGYEPICIGYCGHHHLHASYIHTGTNAQGREALATSGIMHSCMIGNGLNIERVSLLAKSALL
jgi:hypothetical protein